MPTRRDRISRSPKSWAVRAVLAATAAIVGYCGTTFSLARVVAGSTPAFAYRLAPYDGRMTAVYAASLAGGTASAMDRAASDRFANLALRQDPTAVSAVATLGLNADIRGDEAAARRYFTYADTLSRRELRTRLWMIEDAVGRGDVPGALRQYDITLRVFPVMSEILYPVLASASGDPAIRRELIRTLAAKPLWRDSFVRFIAARGGDPVVTAALLFGLRQAGGTIPDVATAGAINGLLAAGKAQAAWSYYAAMRPGSHRRRSRDPRLSGDFDPPSQFDWTPVDDGSGVATSIQGGIFDFTAPATFGGPMLQQLQVLPPGRYQLTGHSIGIEQPTAASPYWSLRCRDGRELGRVEVPNSAIDKGNFSGMFDVPAGCPVQILVLTGRSSDALSGISGQLDLIALKPVV